MVLLLIIQASALAKRGTTVKDRPYRRSLNRKPDNLSVGRFEEGSMPPPAFPPTTPAS